MNKDICNILNDWEYNPNEVTARWINGGDGRPKIQMRLDLGVFQMEAEGRPDGTRPRGYPSLLDYYRSLEKTSKPGLADLKLDEEACNELQQESVQFYYRYLALFALKDHGRVLRDTEHNLEVLKLISRRVDDTELIWQYLQFFPDVRTINAKAQASKLMSENEVGEARKALEEGIIDIRAFWEEHDEEEFDEISPEEETLTEMLAEIADSKPKNMAQKLKEDLAQAISTENYEKAAVIRDELNEMEAAKNQNDG